MDRAPEAPAFNTETASRILAGMTPNTHQWMRGQLNQPHLDPKRIAELQKGDVEGRMQLLNFFVTACEGYYTTAELTELNRKFHFKELTEEDVLRMNDLMDYIQAIEPLLG